MKTDTDVNTVSFTAEHSGRNFRLGRIDAERPLEDGPNRFDDDALKLSGITCASIQVDDILSGCEDGVDINHSHHNFVRVKRLKTRGRFAMTQKGGSSYNVVIIDEIDGHGREVDLDFGNRTVGWPDKAHHLIVAARMKDGSAVVTRALNADIPKLLTEYQGEKYGPYRWAFPWPWLGPVRRWLALAYFWGADHGLWR